MAARCCRFQEKSPSEAADGRRWVSEDFPVSDYPVHFSPFFDSGNDDGLIDCQFVGADVKRPVRISSRRREFTAPQTLDSNCCSFDVCGRSRHGWLIMPAAGFGRLSAWLVGVPLAEAAARGCSIPVGFHAFVWRGWE